MVSAVENMAANTSWSALGKATALRTRILFTLGLLIVYRLGTFIPVPGIDGDALRQFMDSAGQGIGGMVSMFTGGALGRMGSFALGIMPYISASIIVQLMTSMVPSLEQLKKEGEQGRKKINQYTRYGTVALATVQSYGLAVSLEAGDIAADPGLYFRTKQKSDKGKFRVPSLRYTAYTYPYMHNGMLETLRDVVEFYNAGGGENEFSENKSDLIQPLGLEDGEVDALVAFLESLSGEELLIEEPDIPFMEPLPVAQN